MKTLKLLTYALLALIVSMSSCQRDETDLGGDTNPDPELYGNSRIFTVNANLKTDLISELPEDEIELHMLYEGSKYLCVNATHYVEDGISTFELEDYLLQGKYALLGADFATTKSTTDRVDLGLRLTVYEDYNVGPTTFFPELQNEGLGTADNPYIISSAANFSILNNKLATDETFSTDGMYFQQVDDLDFFEYIVNYQDFDGICEDSNRPFMGVYNGALTDSNGEVTEQYMIKNLSITRSVTTTEEEAAATGLFAHISGASLKNIYINKPYIMGYNWVGGLVGAVLGRSGYDSYTSHLTNCKLVDSLSSSITTTIAGKMNVGGLVGGVDYQGAVNLTNCSNEVEDSGLLKLRSGSETYLGYCGGLVGGGSSNSEVCISSCYNKMPISIDNVATNSVGGLVGCANTLTIANSTNYGNISVPSGSIATGGVTGGSINVVLTAVGNSGNVSGGEGVGGIVGSTLISKSDSDGDTYGNVSGNSMINMADVSGELSVGGIVGAAQSSLSNCFNQGVISSSGEGVGGIIGYSPGSITVSCYNVANVSGSDNVGGIIGYAFYFLDNTSVNVGSINSSGAAGGILGMGGTVGTIDYSSNYGAVNGSSDTTGGITGKIGTCSSDEINHRLIVANDLDITLRTIVVTAAEGLAEKFTIAEIGAILFKIQDGFTIVTSLWSGSVELMEMMDEKNELQEVYEENSIVVEAATNDYIDSIAVLMNDYKKNMIYSGDLISSNSTNTYMPQLCYDNSGEFKNYLLLNDGEFCEEYSNAVNETLSAKSVREARLDICKESFAIIAECVICAIAIASEGIAAPILIGVADMAVSKAELWTEDDNNAIVISQVANYGETNGCGLIGKCGDQVEIENSLSAGKASIYTIADNKHDHMKIENLLITGNFDKDNKMKPWAGYDGASNEVMDAYSDNLDEAADFANSKKYPDNYFDDDYWYLDDDYLFAVPYDNKYIGFK